MYQYTVQFNDFFLWNKKRDKTENVMFFLYFFSFSKLLQIMPISLSTAAVYCLLPTRKVKHIDTNSAFPQFSMEYHSSYFFLLTIQKKHLFTSFHSFSLIQDLILSKILDFFHKILQKLVWFDLNKQLWNVCSIFHFKQIKNKLIKMKIKIK